MKILDQVKEPESYPVDDSMIIPPLPQEETARVEIVRGPNIKPLPIPDAPEQYLNAKISLKTVDNITTDDITPASAEFSSMRSNIPLMSQYCYHRYDPDFAARAKELGKSIIIGGENYGQGSSREHAAINPMYLGVKAVIAKSIARIHKGNLVNHGIIPMIFADPADYDKLELMDGILSRKAQSGKPGYSQSLYNLKDAAKMLNFLQTNNIMDMTGLDEKFKSMIGEQLDIQGKLKPVERRLATLKKHLEQADIYFKCKGKKPLTEAEQILFTTAKDYLKGVMNGKTTIPTKAWKEEYTKLTAERKTLNQRYLALKEEVKEAEKIRKNVYGILRQEQREQQTQRKQDMER